jgi:serine O-acetyltransferase
MSDESKRSCVEQCRISDLQDEELRKGIPPVVEQYVEDFSPAAFPRSLEHPIAPSRRCIQEFLELMQTILFPEYFADQSLIIDNFKYYIGTKLNDLFTVLSQQIGRCVMLDCRIEGSAPLECVQIGRREAMYFITRIPALRKAVYEDIEAAFKGDPAAKSTQEIILCYPGVKTVVIYRIAHELHVRRVPLLPRILTEYAHETTGIDIHPGARIGRYFFIDHGTGVVIGETTEIGNWVRLYQGVTLGALSIPKDEKGNVLRDTKRHPTLHDNVVIFANATVLGGETVIGKGSVIGGNVWLTHSVPPYTKVVADSTQKTIPMICRGDGALECTGP